MSGFYALCVKRSGTQDELSRYDTGTQLAHLQWTCAMGKTIAIANQKGGVGKTTTAVNLSACLAKASCQTLLVDIDPQGNAGSGLGFSKEGIEGSLYHALVGEIEAQDLILKTKVENLDLLPSQPTRNQEETVKGLNTIENTLNLKVLVLHWCLGRQFAENAPRGRFNMGMGMGQSARIGSPPGESGKAIKLTPPSLSPLYSYIQYDG